MVNIGPGLHDSLCPVGSDPLPRPDRDLILEIGYM